MQPQQSQPPVLTPPPVNNYDFIMNPAKPPRRPLIGGSSTPIRILVVVGGLFVLAFLAFIVIQVLGAGGGFNKATLLGVAQDQTQLIHLASNGVDNSTTTSNKNFSISAQLSLTSQKNDFLKYLNTNGYKPNEKDLAFKQSAATDTQLTEAKSSSTYDSTYSTVMKDALDAYKRDLTSAYAGASPTGKSLLKADFDAASLLLTQLSSQ